jgi:tRNA-splicing ligase RtcB
MTMIEVKGLHNTAAVYAKTLEPEAERQIRALCDSPFSSGSRIRVMPDVHAGKGCTIGTTMTISDKVVPDIVGVDIGCGMLVSALGKAHIEYSKLDKVIRENVPGGKNVRSEPHAFNAHVDVGALRCAEKVNLSRARLSLGTLGGGNHFIEVDRDDGDNLYLVIHSGSRQMGLQIAEYYQRYADTWMRSRAVAELVNRYKAEGREKELQKAISEMKADEAGGLHYLQGACFDDYLHDMAIAQAYAGWNRRAMADVIARKMKLGVKEQFTTIHNYIDLENMILRKGAISAMKGERVIIPMNMRDGSILALGLGNQDWNCSAPHGAGRLMSRRKARETLSMKDFKGAMEGIFTTSVGRDTIDEAPAAYKPMGEILGCIGETVTVEKVIKPVYNFKAGEGD